MIRFLPFIGVLVSATPACAQEGQAEQVIRFSLKPRMIAIQRILPGVKDGRSPARIAPVVPVTADDRSQDIQIGLQRATHHTVFAGTAASSALASLPRSRMTRYWVEDHLPIGDHVTASLGWHGIRLSNRHANVTAGLGNARLRTRDWFLPRAALIVHPRDDVSVKLGYTETLRAYGDTGTVGPMGLTDSEFQSLRRTLKPETQNRMQVQGNWAVSPALALSLAVHRGRLDDRLGFAGRGLLPVNKGSAQMDGALLEASHAMTPHLGWSLRYSQARVAVAGGAALGERSLSIEARWTDGPWRASARMSHNSAPAIAINRYRPVRLAAGVDYAMATISGRPLRLSIRLTDPDGLASSSFALDDLSGPRHAADLARAVTASAQFDW